MTTVAVDRERAVGALTRWLESLGLPARVAGVVVEHVVAAESVGRRTHGLRLLPHLARGLARSAELPDDVAVAEQEAGTLVVDGAGLPGIFVVQRAIDELIRGHAGGRRSMSVGIVGFAGTTGCLGLYAHRLAEAGLTGLVLATSPPIMATPGGIAPILGTNAISFGAPAGDGAPLVGDFASSERTYGDIALARDRGESVPLGVMLDHAGTPTEDPSAIVDGTLLPSGGQRGWCQALMVEVLAGALTGGKVGNGPGGESVLVLSFAQDAFAAADAPQATAALVEEIRSAEPGPGAASPHVPGDRFEALRRPAAVVDVGAEILDRIEAMGGPVLADRR
ncbi:MAG: Ldh family oxidoreductase [Acidimicrobiales bacterium]